MLFTSLTKANRSHQHSGTQMCPIYPGLTQGTLTLWFRDWVSYLTLVWLQRVSNHPNKPLVAPVDHKVFRGMGQDNATSGFWAHEDRFALIALFWGSKLDSPGSWSDITLSLEISVRLSYLMLFFWFLSFSFLVHLSGGYILASTQNMCGVILLITGSPCKHLQYLLYLQL